MLRRPRGDCHTAGKGAIGKGAFGNGTIVDTDCTALYISSDCERIRWEIGDSTRIVQEGI